MVIYKKRLHVHVHVQKWSVIFGTLIWFYLCACGVQVLQYGTPLLSSTGEEFAQLDADSVYQKMSFQVIQYFN